MSVRYGFIGCGSIGQRRHMPECAGNPKSRVVAVVDTVPSRAQEVAAKYNARAFTDYRAMLKQADIDAVVVCGPNASHAPMSIDALKAGKHVLCEKPMAVSQREALAMIATAKKAKKYLMIGLNQRLMAPHVRAKEILRSGRLGKPLTFRTSFKHPGPDGWSIDGAKSWFFIKNLAFMGVTGDLGVHKADLMRWLLDDEFVAAGGIITTVDKRDARGRLIPLDDNAIISLRTRSGVVGSMEVSWTNYGSEDNMTVIYCQKGVLYLGTDPDYGVIAAYRNGDREMHKVGGIATNVKQVGSRVIDTFTDCILKHKPPEIDGMEGYRSLMVILTAMEAAKRGRTLKVPD